MMELRGDIPGLLRRGSPVSRQSGSGVVVRVLPDILSEVAVVGCNDRSMESVFVSVCTLDLSDPTGRFHARLWLLERGHDVGNEDRAEVLAWSVLSVWRGGPAMPMVAGKWEAEDGDSYARYYLKFKPGSSRYGLAAACVWPEKGGWRTWPPDLEVLETADDFGRPFGPELGDAGKAAADAHLLALGWALTSDDGSLILPPLPGAS